MTLGADYRIDLEVFEGPLDLLLHLVKKHELNIFDIPVAFVTEKYLAYLELMQHLNLEVAGEYLLMAATLAHIKSRELLPAPDPTQADDTGDPDDEGDPRQELIRRLLEYQKYKAAGTELGGRPVIGRNVWRRGASQAEVLDGTVNARADAPLLEVPVFKLVEALAEVLARARIKVSHDVEVERVTIADQISQLADRLDAEGAFSFLSCFSFVLDGEHTALELRQRVVVTLLAILEMARLNLVRVVQPDATSDIQVMTAVPSVRDRASGAIGNDYR